MQLLGKQHITLIIFVTSLLTLDDAYVSGSNDVIKQLKDGALKLKNEMGSLITNNLGYNLLQVHHLFLCKVSITINLTD